MNIRVAFGTLFGVGHLPVAPGTWGSFFTLPFIYIAATYFPEFGIPAFFLVTCVLSLVCSSAAVEKFGKDPAEFVLDESAGQSIVFILTGFAFTPAYDIFQLALGFLLFRFFDILKPMGVDKLQTLPGEIGILADDILAGIYALICLEGSMYIYQRIFF